MAESTVGYGCRLVPEGSEAGVTRTAMSFSVGAELVEALGLTGQRVRSIELRFATDEIVKANVEMYVHDKEAHKLIALLKRFELQEKSSQAIEVTDLTTGVREYLPVGAK